MPFFHPKTLGHSLFLGGEMRSITIKSELFIFVESASGIAKIFMLTLFVYVCVCSCFYEAWDENIA